MSLTPFAYGLTALLLWLLGIAVYQFAIAGTGRAFGIRVREVAIGFGPSLLQKPFNDWRLRLGVLPFGGYTKFRGTGDEADDELEDFEEEGAATGSWKDATASAQLATVLSGPFAVLLLGLLLLGLPVWWGADELVVTPAGESMIRPCAVGGLALRDRPSRWKSQGQLLRDTVGEFALRLVAFQSLEGWGGFFGFLVTAGKIGELSGWAWLTSVGTLFVWTGLINLLPVPGVNGFHALGALYKGVAGRPLPEWVSHPLTSIGLLLILVFWIRLLWVDGRWLYGVVFE